MNNSYCSIDCIEDKKGLLWTKGWYHPNWVQKWITRKTHKKVSVVRQRYWKTWNTCVASRISCMVSRWVSRM